jgi:cytochrome P450
MHALFDTLQDRYRANPDHSALSVMTNADQPIPKTQIYANIKVAIGGGINEPRDALNTTVFGLLSNPDQLAEVKRNKRLGGPHLKKVFAGLPPFQRPLDW